MTYKEFIESKIDIAPQAGIELSPEEVNPILKPHQRDAVLWAARGGRRGVFARFGLGKTVIQLEWCRLIQKHIGGKALIIMPLNVMPEFRGDAVNLLGMPPLPYVKTMAEANACTQPILITNYERVRDGDIDPKQFTAVSLDEAATLRSFGSKTYQEFLHKFKGVRFKLTNTATPSPNRFKELIHYAAFLEIMDSGQSLTRFFKRDSTKANNLTIYPGREREFWIWCASWGLFLQKPSDLGYSDAGYSLPPLDVRWHMLQSAERGGDFDKDGQLKLGHDAAMGLQDASREKRDSIQIRAAACAALVKENSQDHFVIWHDLENERAALEKSIPEMVDIYGSMELETREQRVIDFAYGKTRVFGTKKSLSGSGCNFQRFCHREIFMGIDYEFNDFIQAVHRCYRFLQQQPVTVDIFYMDTEGEVRRELERKWRQYEELSRQMEAIIKEYGLGSLALEALKRTIGCERMEIQGKNYTAINNDCVEEIKRWPSDSIDLYVTSIPFGNHYEYSPSYNDFGHNPNDDEFFKQMDYLTPELLRTLKPGRVAAIHVKDRVLFGSVTGDGMPTIEPFHADTIHNFTKHGFRFFGMITVVTDVVRENNQTYRLGYTKHCQDGTTTGVGCPEYVLLFRKLPTDHTKGFSDSRVKKEKSDYPLSRWQLDAAAYWRSSGDRPVTLAEVEATPHKRLKQVYRKYSRQTVYNYDAHVAMAERLAAAGKLSSDYAVVDPGSWRGDVWDNINRMRTLNTSQKLKKREMHICPLQLDIIERLVELFSQKGELVADPFAGLFSVPYMAVKMGRKGKGVELNPDYFRDGVGYCELADAEGSAPTLFDLLEEATQ